MSSIEINKDTYLMWYEQMLLMRRFEEKTGQLYGQQKIRGFCHLYIGQEAVLAGAMSVIKPEDSMITAYRDHAHALAKGVTPNAIMAEMYGKATGCSKGKGGSMHMFDKEKHFYGGHGIVGGQVPLGAGIAFAEKYKGTEFVNIAYMGDGAVRQGALTETFNMAALWKLPVIFVCENNGYAMGTSVERTTAQTDIYKLGLPYGIPSSPVDGMDPAAVHVAMDEAVQRARAGEGPTFLEMRTYRYKGHSMSDPQKYRTKEELESYKAKDPLEATKQTILAEKYADEAWFDEMDAKIKAIVDEAVKFAEESPWPDASELYTDVYVQEDYPYIRD
ncbi:MULTISPECIES: pyruvate dehydrogenase (acetyl-transferring) E1 component subunit alpha [Mucilaginibacter]|jgi:pyruvate dehydrogenase E1 component alpha subunit|uniref:Pyruvate dehydrogenase E1 component subunit alpha n=2 Tax=Mucilaginibacter TaxID=423349 RepID=A0AAE6JKK7_9SPHI|nr:MULTISPECIES: pyruvate dehydrogenase (acetyl-transferring) E1 component subunit alpha [Mucilaginibacter]NVM67459.1 pyruvate dehydrogenase E1 component alpha subunit [Mucilaginibacter sp. SG538B]QEM07454.1 pyruvate dehydrogenase (acetyl-transferring) E1 component subunit alpha [Mucilaginibacter rubeus]QEM19907.1 pyruvate dehydrogenase (acetyl-transferring) E1 component subunit alpha [Mucilaginibacter gossypii]QTE35078.1 pyruvate dehydrogenase (acetyl-transferring) E1 component subunit alpha [